MPVPASINDLSTTAGSNSPAGTETPTEGDNYIRTYGSFIALLRDKLNGTSDTGTVKNATFSGTMAGAAAWSALQTFAGGLSVTSTAGNIAASTYTPTLTGILNVDGTLATACQYIRVGSVVTVSGLVAIDATAAGATRVGISLPFASDFTDFGQLAGTASAVAEPTRPGAIFADTTNNRAELNYTATTGTGQLSWYFTFTYRIL
jgi:hypothetical protein